MRYQPRRQNTLTVDVTLHYWSVLTISGTNNSEKRFNFET